MSFIREYTLKAKRFLFGETNSRRILKSNDHGFVVPSGPTVHPDYADKALCELTANGIRLLKLDSDEYRKVMKQLDKRAELSASLSYFGKLHTSQPWMFGNLDIGTIRLRFLLSGEEPGKFLVIRAKYNYRLFFLTEDLKEKNVIIIHKYKKEDNRVYYKFIGSKKYYLTLIDLVQYAQTHVVKQIGMKLTNGVDPTKFCI